MSKITPCLWYDGDAEEAANFYVTLLPDSRMGDVTRSPADNPSGPAGMVLTVEFTLAGQDFVGLNGGPLFKFNEAISFQIECADQEEIDRLWNRIASNGGEPGPCGWIKDRWGLSWQINAARMTEMLKSEDREAARRAMEAMLEMGKLDIAKLEKAFAG
ncbi:VOC family protein [Sphingosinicella rhizophila]|uniref:VOC family protein n=1 Tax=Sphingosinicella rhizophila TaxID=3050082 RepID=A0ABU3Q6J6_9SPHN|nr:VOC family protein [Sphingosinicella sp. GR2756]MDT9599028.1 VOC family protein [Sphingosinicella sp. GR2756]